MLKLTNSVNITVMIILILVVFGLILGSFTNALIWRLHEQTKLAKRKNKTVSRELSIWRGRSMCPNCRHQLAAKDLVPILSWLWLRGKCRYCKKSISWQYPLVEALMAGVFIFSYYMWPVSLHGSQTALFVLWLGILIIFMALAVYDILWHLLPNVLIYPLMVLAITMVLVKAFASSSSAGDVLLGSLWGVLFLAGLFYVLFQLSQGKWIGGGDVKLAVPLGLMAGGTLATALLLLMASVGGTLLSVPLMMEGKANRNTKVPFGPFLILGAVFVVIFGNSIISWYKSLLNG